ncbi:MAG: class I SAM-dependent methyltransferase [Acidimicrobiales bacterium]
MASTEPSNFYTGIVADLYAPLKGETFPAEPYARFIARWGEPALELACGDGEPLLELCRSGLDVAGLDSSADMIERCRRRAAERGVDVTLYVARMEEMALGRRFRSIFLAGPSFNLVPDDDAARDALARIGDHLDPDGAALVPLWIPPPTPADALGVARRRVLDDGTVIAVTPVGEERDELLRCRRTVLRYERSSPAGVESAEREWLLHWYTPDGFTALVESAGLRVLTTRGSDGGPLQPGADSWAVTLGSAD